MEFENYKNALEELISWHKQVEVKNRNEATTRLHLISPGKFPAPWGE